MHFCDSVGLFAATVLTTWSVKGLWICDTYYYIDCFWNIGLFWSIFGLLFGKWSIFLQIWQPAAGRGRLETMNIAAMWTDRTHRKFSTKRILVVVVQWCKSCMLSIIFV